MASTVTVSISIPVELSIKIEAYIDNQKMTRSEFIKEAVENYLHQKERENMNAELTNKIYEEILLIKKQLKIL